jgi:hypothetical protein
MAHPHPKLLRSRCPWKPEVSGKCGAWSKSCHRVFHFNTKSDEVARSPELLSYWSELATWENALLAFDPIKRTVPTTRTRITANITAYSAMSCPASSDQSRCINLDICSPPGRCQFLEKARTEPKRGADIMHAGAGFCQCAFRDFPRRNQCLGMPTGGWVCAAFARSGEGGCGSNS